MVHCRWQAPEETSVRSETPALRPLWSQAEVSERIYIVTWGDYSGYHIKAVFSTQEKASEFISANCPGEGEIEDWPVDEMAGWTKRTVYTCLIPDGKRWTFEVSADPNLRVPDPPKCGTLSKGQFQGFSFESDEHARKIAVEARQAYLREHGPVE